MYLARAKGKERCSDSERRNLFTDIKEKRPLIFYSEIKSEWVKEEHGAREGAGPL